MNTVTQLSEYPRRKQLDITDAMLDTIRAAAGTDLVADDIVVFECTAVNTMPLNKEGSVFHEGRLTRSTLSEMATRLNTGVESVPLHTLHMQGDEIPVGKVFHGYVQDMANGHSELRAQFYLAKSESTLIEKMNLGILDEVSVGLKSKQMLCSKCGFDYFGDDTDFMALWDRTCSNGHVLGTDGTHVVLSGVDTWMELSLVSRGAAHKAKIHGRAGRFMSKEQQDRIAASGFTPDAVTLFASPQLPKQEDLPMPDKIDEDALVAKIVTALTASLTPKIEETITPPAVVEEEEPKVSELDALKAQIGELKEQIAELGKPKAADLTTDLPAGGVAASAITDAKKAEATADLGAFKLRK